MREAWLSRPSSPVPYPCSCRHTEAEACPQAVSYTHLDQASDIAEIIGYLDGRTAEDRENISKMEMCIRDRQ